MLSKIISIGFSVLLIGCASSNTASVEQRDQTIQKLVAEQDINGLFRGSYQKKDYPLNSAITEILQTCCEQGGEAVRFLRKNGFNMSDKSQSCEWKHDQTKRQNFVCMDKGKYIDKDYYKRQGYDEVYIGQDARNTFSIFPLVTHNIEVYIKNNKVEKVMAYISSSEL